MTLLLSPFAPREDVKTGRSTGIGIGLLLALAVGAATPSRAQQAGEKQDLAPAAKGELRERVLRLRTELDVVQVEFDAARSILLGSLKRLGNGDRDDGAKVRGEVRQALNQIKLLGTMSGVEFTDQKIGELANDLKADLGAAVSNDDLKLIRDWLKEGPQSETAADRIADLELKERAKLLQAAIDRERKDLSRIARKRNELKLELSEAEKQYQREASRSQ